MLRRGQLEDVLAAVDGAGSSGMPAAGPTRGPPGVCAALCWLDYPRVRYAPLFFAAYAFLLHYLCPGCWLATLPTCFTSTWAGSKHPPYTILPHSTDSPAQPATPSPGSCAKMPSRKTCFAGVLFAAAIGMASFSRGGAEPWRPTGVVRSPSLVQRDDSLVVSDRDELRCDLE
jgi:hypothetical protein